MNKAYHFASLDFRYYGDKVPQRLLNTNSRRVQHRIVMLHNYLRTNVRPSASNMLEMVSYGSRLSDVILIC